MAFISESRLFCTTPSEHGYGQHTPACVPPADPEDAELRLYRAVWGLCGYCDRTDAHRHLTPDDDITHGTSGLH